MAILGIFTAFTALLASVAAIPTGYDSVDSTAMACTTGTPVTTAGYPINYAKATPTGYAEDVGYQPHSDWASQHVVATYTYGVPSPIETGFAYAQFKCQYTCNAAGQGSSFFVAYTEGQSSSFCSCYNDLLREDAFVSANQTTVGAWNAICGVTHPGKK